MTLLAKSTIRPEDVRNPIRHLGLERGFPPSIAVQTAASEFANSVVLWRHPDVRFTRVGKDMSSIGIDGEVSPSANLFTIHHVQTSSTLEARKSLFDPGRDP
jgi:hypothetical protein